jgi:hypothetical protein
MTTVKINENNIFTVLTAGSLALLVLLAVVGFLFGSVRFALSVLAGGVLAIANFYWLRSILVRAFRLTPEQAPRFALFRYVVRLAVLAAVVFVLIVTYRADVFGLLLGLSVLVINIMALSFYMMSAKGD